MNTLVHTTDELRASVEEGTRQVEAGQYYTDAQVKQYNSKKGNEKMKKHKIMKMQQSNRSKNNKLQILDKLVDVVGYVLGIGLLLRTLFKEEIQQSFLYPGILYFEVVLVTTSFIIIFWYLWEKHKEKK